jgi:hypothetical protein
VPIEGDCGDIGSYEATMRSLALLKILALSEASRRKRKWKPVKQAFAALRKRVSAEKTC